MDIQSLANRLSANDMQLMLRILPAVLILLLTRLLNRFDIHLLRRVLKVIDRAADIMQGKDVPLDKQLEKALTPPMRLLIDITGIWLAILVLDLPNLLGRVVYQIAHSFIAVILFWALYRLVDVAVYYVRENKDRYAVLDEPVIRFGTQLVKASIVLFAFVLVMKEWGYDLGALIAGLGIGGLAVALAAQDALANLIGYFVIMIDAPFHEGDSIVSGNITGKVEEIGFRSIKVRQSDQALAVVPNKVITATTLINWSRLSKRRLSTTLSISRAATPAQILDVVKDIRAMLNARDLVISGSVKVQFAEFGENSLDVLVVCMLNTPVSNDFAVEKQAIHLAVMEVLNEHGVQLAVGQAVLLERGGSAVASTTTST